MTTLEGRVGHDALFYTPLTIASLRDETRMNLRCMAKYLENTDFSKNIVTQWRMSCAIQVVVLFVGYAFLYTLTNAHTRAHTRTHHIRTTTSVRLNNICEYVMVGIQ